MWQMQVVGALWVDLGPLTQIGLETARNNDEETVTLDDQPNYMYMLPLAAGGDPALRGRTPYRRNTVTGWWRALRRTLIPR